MLESLEDLRPYYQFAKDGPVDQNTRDAEQEKMLKSSDEEAPLELDVHEARERRKFENSKLVQKEAMKAFRELKAHEYWLVCMYKPEKISGNSREYMEKMSKKEKES